MAFWHVEDSKKKAKPPIQVPEPWDTGAISADELQKAELDFEFGGGAVALEEIREGLEASAADLMNVPDAFMTGLETGGLYLSAEGAALRWLMLQSADTEGPKVVSPEKAKEEYDIDVDQPISIREAFIRQDLKKDYEKQLKEWGDSALQLEQPATTLATWVGTAAALWALPSTRSGAFLIEKSLVAGGAAISNAAMMHSAAKLGGKVNELKTTTKIMAGMQKPLNRLNKYADKLNPTAQDVIAITGVQGTANALEAIAAHQIEKEIGNNYDMTGELALGYAAPAVMGAAVRIAKGLRGTADTVTEFDRFGKAIDKKLFEKASGQEAWVAEMGKVKRQARTAKETVVKEETALTKYKPEHLLESAEDGAMIRYQPEYRITDRKLLPAGETKFLEAADDAVEAVMDAAPELPLLLESRAYNKMLEEATETPAVKKVRKRRKAKPKEEAFTAADKKAIKDAFENTPGLQAELETIESLALLQKLYGESALNAMQDLTVAWKKMDIEADITEVFPWLRNIDETGEHAMKVGLDARAEDLFQLTREQTDALLKRVQPKAPEAKIIKEPQPVTKEADPVKAVQEAATESAAAERAKMTTDAALQESEKFITFKDPKTGKMLKFEKEKIQKIEGHAAGRLREDANVGPTGGVTQTTPTVVELGDTAGKGRGPEVLVKHVDDPEGEAFLLPESFVNRLDKYEKEFPNFPKIERVNKMPFQQTLADVSDNIDKSFKEFKKCIGKGGK